MTNEELLKELYLKAQSGEIKKEEITAVFESFPPSEQGGGSILTTDLTAHLSLTKILYLIGASVVVIGISFFGVQIWDDLGALGRITITLGLGLIFAAFGSIFFINDPERWLGPVFHVIGGVLIPGGSLVTLYELSLNVKSLWPVAWIFGVLFVFYLLLTLFHKNAILTFFSAANGTAFIYLLVGAMLGNSFYYEAWDVFVYLTMAASICYLLLAHAFRDGWNKYLCEMFNFMGAAGFLGAAFTRVFDSGLWQFAFFIFAFGGMAFAVYAKSRGILAVSTLYLVAHFIYITNEYFADSIGWPVALVILGLLIIGLGYVSISINKKYLR